MLLNQRIRYGVACLYELSKVPGGFLEADRIAERQNVPVAYAQKILQALSKSGLAMSLKGQGYRLVRPLRFITALELIEALSREHEDAMAPVGPGGDLENRIHTALKSVTLGDLTA